jgi:hypothetical protein
VNVGSSTIGAGCEVDGERDHEHDAASSSVSPRSR